MTTITVEGENYGQGGDGPFRAGIAIVRLNGEVVAKIRTSERIEFKIREPEITTSHWWPHGT